MPDLFFKKWMKQDFKSNNFFNFLKELLRTAIMRTKIGICQRRILSPSLPFYTPNTSFPLP